VHFILRLRANVRSPCYSCFPELRVVPCSFVALVPAPLHSRSLLLLFRCELICGACPCPFCLRTVDLCCPHFFAVCRFLALSFRCLPVWPKTKRRGVYSCHSLCNFETKCVMWPKNLGFCASCHSLCNFETKCVMWPKNLGFCTHVTVCVILRQNVSCGQK